MNELRGNVWNLLVADPNTPVKSGYVFVKTISWQGYADMNDHVYVRDGRGNTLLESFGNSDLSPIEVDLGGAAIRDLTLEGLDSGRVVVSII